MAPEVGCEYAYSSGYAYSGTAEADYNVLSDEEYLLLATPEYWFELKLLTDADPWFVDVQKVCCYASTLQTI